MTTFHNSAMGIKLRLPMILFIGTTAMMPQPTFGDPLTFSESFALGYTSPAVWGLIAGGAYPNPDDVCQLIKPNDLTKDFEEPGVQLIGCPVHEFGAIHNREEEGAQKVGHIGAWLLFALPSRLLS